MKHEIENILLSQGYKVRPNGEVYKYSNSTKSQKKLGQLNETNIYFYGSVPHPYTNNPTFYSEILGADKVVAPYVPKVKFTEAEHNFTLQNYYDTTKAKNQFQLYVNQYDEDNNVYDIRGIKDGYLTDASLFPYINFKGEFVTAKIIQYNSKTGKRSSKMNWFHAYENIKEDLNLDVETKISKKVNCFFGEHLVAYSEKNVIIVESEKTAILTSLLFPQLVFIATGSKGRLKNIDKTFLKDRNVFVYPDKDAHNDWLKIADANDWFCSEIIHELGADKTDIADYFKEVDNPIGDLIADELTLIADGEIEYEYDNTQLDFKVKSKTNYNYCIPNYQVHSLTTYTDNAKGSPFNGNNFNIFSEPFQAINSNVDFNRWRYSKGRSYQVDAKEFLKRLEKTFRVMKHLNKDANHIRIFYDVLQYLIENSNFTFNKYYVRDVLLAEWNADANDISKYYKDRIWRFKGSKVTIGRDEFLKHLYQDIKASNIYKYLIKIRPLVASEKFICNKAIGLKDRQKEPFVWDLIKRYNDKVLGCSTINNYNKKLTINEYFIHIAKVHNSLENVKWYVNSCTPYYTSNIVCKEKRTKIKNPSYNVIQENTFIRKEMITEYMNFNSDYDTLLETKVIISYLLDSPLELIYTRSDGRIIASVKNDYETMKQAINIKLNKIDEPIEHITLEQAFDYPLDLSNSVLNVDEEEAIMQGNYFKQSWVKFNANRELTAMELMMLEADAEAFIFDGHYANIS